MENEWCQTKSGIKLTVISSDLKEIKGCFTIWILWRE